ncbi:MAG TPA: hypothetical protein VNO70_13245 [Blastocatellia bacterium]|nr:hypothetical protein [Blastocatellia bacterium]
MAERTNVSVRARADESEAERSAEEIRQDIAARRESISETVDRLSNRFQETLDWRTYVGDYPLVALGVAAGIGFLLSGLFKPRPTPRDRIMDALAESVEDLTDRFRNSLDNLDVLPHKKKMGLSRTVKAALTATVTKAATDYLKKKADQTFRQRWGAHPEATAEFRDASAYQGAQSKPIL